MGRLRTLMASMGGGFGLLSQLVAQPDNDGQKSIRFTRANSLQSGPPPNGRYLGSFSPSKADYVAGDRVSLGNYFDFQVPRGFVGNVPVGTYPDPTTDTAYWQRLIGVEIRRDLQNGSHMYDSLVYSNDDSKHWGLTQRITMGAPSTTAIKYSNIDPAASAIGASASSITIAALPATYSLTVAAGLSSVLFAPIAIGACTDSMTIGSAVQTPTFINITLPTGQTLNPGDAIKLEINASNFNIARIIDYDSITGDAYIAIINGVGTGTSTSWTVSKVALIFASWPNPGPTFVWFTAHIITYDNGTGAITCRAFTQVGSGTRAGWNVWLGRQNFATSGSGTIIHQEDQVMGQMWMGRYYTDRLVHVSTKRTTACGARYIILDGPDAGNEYTIDMYNATTVIDTETVVASDLSIPPPAGYRYIAFLIASPSSGSNTQGNINYNYTNIHGTVSPYPGNYHRLNIDTFSINNPMAGGGFSSGEIAFNYRKAGTADTLYWLWDHNLIDGVRYTTPPVFTVDGVAIDTTEISSYDGKFQNFNTFTLVQVGEIFHPDQVSKMGDITITHGYDNNGLYWDIILSLTQDWEISTGYEDMIAFPQAGGGERWFDTMLTNLGGTFTWPGGSSPVAISGNQIGWTSGLFKSTNNTYANNQDYALAQWRKADSWGASGNVIGYSGGPKLYPLKYSGSTIPAGSVLRIVGRQFAGHKGSL